MVEETGEFIDVTPNYGPTLEWMAMAMTEHGYERDTYSVMAEMLRTAGWLAQRQPALLVTVITNLNNREEGRRPIPYPKQEV